MTILETEKLAQKSKVILIVIDLVLIVITKGHCQVTL